MIIKIGVFKMKEFICFRLLNSEIGNDLAFLGCDVITTDSFSSP